MTVHEAREAGMDAAAEHADIFSNPFNKRTHPKHYEAWDDGYDYVKYMEALD